MYIYIYTYNSVTFYQTTQIWGPGKRTEPMYIYIYIYWGISHEYWMNLDNKFHRIKGASGGPMVWSAPSTQTTRCQAAILQPHMTSFPAVSRLLMNSNELWLTGSHMDFIPLNTYDSWLSLTEVMTKPIIGTMGAASGWRPSTTCRAFFRCKKRSSALFSPRLDEWDIPNQPKLP